MAAGTGAAYAQASASFKLEEHAFNSGGHPSDGGAPASAGFRISLGAIGDSVQPGSLSSPSFRLAGDFVSAYPPPGEVLDLLLSADDQTLRWDAERSAGDYNLYRGSLAALSGLGYGDCLQQDLPGTSATDVDVPSPGEGFFYLVTAENLLAEEGTKGFDGSGAERAGTPCP